MKHVSLLVILAMGLVACPREEPPPFSFENASRIWTQFRDGSLAPDLVSVGGTGESFLVTPIDGDGDGRNDVRYLLEILGEADDGSLEMGEFASASVKYTTRVGDTETILFNPETIGHSGRDDQNPLLTAGVGLLLLRNLNQPIRECVGSELYYIQSPQPLRPTHTVCLAKSEGPRFKNAGEKALLEGNFLGVDPNFNLGDSQGSRVRRIVVNYTFDVKETQIGSFFILLVDSDGDGFSDELELEEGTDPDDPDDFPGSDNHVTIPSLAGLLLEVARDLVEDLGLVVGDITHINSDTTVAGRVISSDPVGGTSVDRGSEVDLVVSLGPTKVAVPNVIGFTEASAREAIIEAKLQVGQVTTANSDTVATGRVISSTPSAGALVDRNSTVSLVVSSGPEVTNHPPEIINIEGPLSIVVGETGRWEIIARDIDGDNLGILFPDDPPGSFRQGKDPVRTGDVVTFTVDGEFDEVGNNQVLVFTVTDPGELSDSDSFLVNVTGEVDEEIEVPDVVGLEEAVARAVIVENDLRVGTVSYEHDETISEGIVISTSPEAGTLVLPLSDVNLLVSLGPEVNPLPPVVGEIEGPRSLLTGQAGQWTIEVIDPDREEADSLGLTYPGEFTLLSREREGTKETFVLGRTFTEAGSYTLSFTATDVQGLSDSATPITIVVTDEITQVGVPDVIGKTQAEAELLITNAQLSVGQVTTASSDTIAAGRVISSTPVGGTLVNTGTNVDLVVSSGPAGPTPFSVSIRTLRSDGQPTTSFTMNETATLIFDIEGGERPLEAFLLLYDGTFMKLSSTEGGWVQESIEGGVAALDEGSTATSLRYTKTLVVAGSGPINIRLQETGGLQRLRTASTTINVATMKTLNFMKKWYVMAP